MSVAMSHIFTVSEDSVGEKLNGGFMDLPIPDISMSNPRRERNRKWSAISDEFREWIDNPTALANEDGEYPSTATIRLAWRLAEKIARSGSSAPIAVVTDGNIGISFEWRSGATSRWLEVSSTGDIDEIVIENGQVRSRSRIIFDD
jgi:hypothetical protein